MAVSVQRVSQALSEKHQRGIRLTGTPGYQVEKDPTTGDAIITYYTPAGTGHEQVKGEVLAPYIESLDSADLDYTYDAESGLIRVTGRKTGADGRGNNMTEEGRNTLSQKLRDHWKTHKHPLEGKSLTDEAKQNIRNKLNARKVVTQNAMQLYLQALTAGVMTLPECEGLTHDEVMDVVKGIASGEVAASRAEYNKRQRERRVEMKERLRQLEQQVGDSVPTTDTPTPGTNGVHPVETEATTESEQEQVAEGESENPDTQYATTVIREGDPNATTMFVPEASQDIEVVEEPDDSGDDEDSESDSEDDEFEDIDEEEDEDSDSDDEDEFEDEDEEDTEEE